MAMRLLSVNVATPRTFEWRGQIVSSAMFKKPVSDRRWVGTLTIDGDDQADKQGHGGEHRAVFVYQIERLNEPRMAALLTGHGRPGFYLRVLQPGEVGAEDEITFLGGADDRPPSARSLICSTSHTMSRRYAAPCR
jgi:MOSC domain-containing protein YiiM